ncbi:MAG: tRNA (N(6)-L-threonylcarbamoyladenosine(37)-C(2))-methylthiotransferase MtaB [Caulobacterales bacterium]
MRAPIPSLEPSAQAPEAPGVDVITLGCRLNAYESDVMAAQAQAAGLANTVIVNTCAVTAEAVRQASQAIRRLRRERPDAAIIVTGCAATIEPERFSNMPEVTHVIGNGEKELPGTFAALVAQTLPRVAADDIMTVREMAPHMAGVAGSRTRAFVAVQNGCDHRCTFCVIPYGRGNARSMPAGGVVDEVRRLVELGTPEVVLTGVDLTSWGADLPGQPQLGNLVARILKLVPDLPLLRLSSIDAIEMDDLLFELVTGHERVAPYLHLSLQHGDDLILKRMKRRHSRADAVALALRLKAARPGIALGADLIAGFPTETEAHLASSVSLIQEAQLSFVHVFPYSARPNTPAARMPQLARAEVKRRASVLRDAAASALTRHLEGWVGRTAHALVEEDGNARLPDFSPVRIDGGTAGDLCCLRFTSHDGHRLQGTAA